MSRLLDSVPHRVSPLSMVVTTPRPAYRAPRPAVVPQLRPRAVLGGSSLGGDAGLNADPDAAFDDATAYTPPPSTGDASASGGPCGCK